MKAAHIAVGGERLRHVVASPAGQPARCSLAFRAYKRRCVNECQNFHSYVSPVTLTVSPSTVLTEDLPAREVFKNKLILQRKSGSF